MLGVGGMRVVDGHLTIGMLVAFLSLAASFTRPVEEVVGLGKQILELKGDINRLDDVLQYPQDPWHLLDDAKAAKNADQQEPQNSVTHAKFEGRIEMTDVTFGYTPSGTPLIENFNLMVEPGERIAIVGPSGCGKSTVSRLLMGLYEPWSGEIKFDDKRRMDYPRQVFFSSVALVDQDVVLFEGSVRDNLTMWDATVSDQDMIQAAKDACIHDFIMARPGGYESPIEEGGQNMSGGQRQRFEIARALATNPRVVVMDEGTSALDPTTERLIDQNLRRRGCSCVIIAHRLSTIRDADEIIVLSSGHIVERGPHEELLENPDGFYARLISQI
jgi:ABC-type bacteriocin/lantibiotic exporter with double-glycine peptidase domain